MNKKEFATMLQALLQAVRDPRPTPPGAGTKTKVAPAP